MGTTHRLRRSSTRFHVVVTTRNRSCLFGEVVGGRTAINRAGEMLLEEWSALGQRFAGLVHIGRQVMPNHFHGALDVKAVAYDDPQDALERVIGAWKSRTTLMYIRGVRQLGWRRFPKRLWAASFHRTPVWSDNQLEAVLRYIHVNPERW